tara:strand:+ start:303 stop:533 length:231 start_codon:yes stop_codon:yes gene_type:complete
MIKYLAIPLILVGCTAPVTDPPAHAIPQEQMEMIWEALEYVKEYDVLQNRTEPNDAITSALDDFWEETGTLDEEQE